MKEEQLTNASSYLTEFVTSKDRIESFVIQVCAEVESGSLNPLSLAVKMKSLEKAMEEIRKRTSGAMLNEAAKFSKHEEIIVHGAKIEVAEFGVSYDYAKSNDFKWGELDKAILELKELQKNREEFLKKLPEAMADTETGEVINMPVKKSTTGLKITIK